MTKLSKRQLLFNVIVFSIHTVHWFDQRSKICRSLFSFHRRSPRCSTHTNKLHMIYFPRQLWWEQTLYQHSNGNNSNNNNNHSSNSSNNIRVLLTWWCCLNSNLFYHFALLLPPSFVRSFVLMFSLTLYSSAP